MKNNFHFFKLEEVSKISAGGDKPKNFSKTKNNKYQIPVFANGETNKGLQGFTDKARVHKSAVTVSARGTIGYPVLRYEPFVPIIRLLTLIPKSEKLDVQYLYYYLVLYRQAGLGSSQAQLTVPDISNRKILVPSLSEQHVIGKILSILDEKIELNNKINTELEQMAKTIYEYWFVQFDFPDKDSKSYKSSGGKMSYNNTLKRYIPEAWEGSNILTVAELLGGGTPAKKKPEYWDGKIPFFTPTDADGSLYKFTTADYITEKGLSGSSTKLFDENTVLITARGSVGRLVLAGTKMAMNQSCYALKAKVGISYAYLFFLTKELIYHLQVKSSGSVFDSIVSNDIEFSELAIPTPEVIKSFSQVVEPMFENIKKNTRENQCLVELRDWLLPMLMNGQITIK